MARVDIIIPLYNGQRRIARALRSVCNQRFADWRCIVVDDGSTDDGPAIVRNIDDSRIQLIQQENRGPGAARNTGVTHGSAPLLAFLDADDEWYPWYLENALAALAHSDVAAVSSTYYEWPTQRDLTPVFASRGVPVACYQLTGAEAPDQTATLWSLMQVWNTVLRREAFDQAGGFYDKNYCRFGEDQCLFGRVLFQHPVAVISPAAVRYHREDSTLSRRHRRHPLPPYLADATVMTDHCPPEKRALLDAVLAWRALTAAHQAARIGWRERADDLLQRFPAAQEYPAYQICRRDMDRTAAFHCWVRTKCLLGPTKQCLQNWLLRTLRLIPAAPKIQDTSTLPPTP